MDAFLLTQALEQPAETYIDKMDKVVIVEKRGFSFMKMLQLILSLAISAYAAYLSWNCSVGEPAFIRILSALLAWFFGVLYILFYIMFKSKSCAMM
ncbi:hypothetical protein PBCVOR070422_841L [Paramecium bursaria Chlorella virus OR0704.2.2]|jgi:hypothetical protein|nr:hypothetical protein PBCVCZ2_844L [Paramecium bursaria Chlorella virus CZ-2]AGE59240.1 hypothetical protein PBCVOR070422_841L [Paramecium bursaria Chlorella virus OR0704.2.2]